MKHFRSPLIRRALLASVLLSLAVAGAGWYFVSPLCALVCAIPPLLAGGYVSVVLICQYRDIENITKYVSGVLHGCDALNMSMNAEGEVSILQNEVYKLVSALRQQLDMAGEEKRFLSDSLADISHQLKTPLTSLHMISRFLRAPETDALQRQGYVRDMEKQLTRMDWLIQTLLKIARIDAGTAEFRRESVAVKPLVERALEPFGILLDVKNIRVSILGNDDCRFEGDPMWSTEAISNILKNCIEYTQEDGSISIAFRETLLDTTLTIRDSGIGLTENDCKNIFKRFYRGEHADNTGAGIGMSLANQIVQNQNGTITATNHPEGGSEFVIRFSKRVV